MFRHPWLYLTLFIFIDSFVAVYSYGQNQKITLGTALLFLLIIAISIFIQILIWKKTFSTKELAVKWPIGSFLLSEVIFLAAVSALCALLLPFALLLGPVGGWLLLIYGVGFVITLIPAIVLSFINLLFYFILERNFLTKVRRPLIFFLIIIFAVGSIWTFLKQAELRAWAWQQRVADGINLVEEVDPETKIFNVQVPGSAYTDQYVRYRNAGDPIEFYVMFDYFRPSLRPAMEFIKSSLPADATILAVPGQGHTIRSYTKRNSVAYLPSLKMIKAGLVYDPKIHFGLTGGIDTGYDVPLLDEGVGNDIMAVFGTNDQAELVTKMKKLRADYILVNGISVAWIKQPKGQYVRNWNQNKAIWKLAQGETLPGLELVYWESGEKVFIYKLQK